MKEQKDIKTEFNIPFIEQRADPYIYRANNGDYYFTASVPEYNKIILRKSKKIKDLQNAEEITIWTAHKEGPQSLHVWAPEIHYLDGCWYIYYAASQKDDPWRLRPYVLRCTGQDPINDKWEELGMIQPADGDLFSFQDFSLDATVLCNKNEKYIVWAEKVGHGKKVSNLYIAKLETPWKLATEQVLLTGPDYDWERIGFWVNEGPAFLKHNGKIFMTYSASEKGASYCMGMLSIDENADLLDPRAWKKERYPVLCSDEEKKIFGPGHNSFVKAEDGVTDLCVYHLRQYTEIEGDPLYNPDRHTAIMKINYDEAGNPIFNYEKVDYNQL